MRTLKVLLAATTVALAMAATAQNASAWHYHYHYRWHRTWHHTSHWGHAWHTRYAYGLRSYRVARSCPPGTHLGYMGRFCHPNRS